MTDTQKQRPFTADHDRLTGLELTPWQRELVEAIDARAEATGQTATEIFNEIRTGRNQAARLSRRERRKLQADMRKAAGRLVGLRPGEIIIDEAGAVDE